MLGTTGCGAEDAIVHGETGLLAEPGVDQVEAALARLLGDDAERERMAQRGREHANQNTWGPNAQRVLDLYREAMG